jgi:hypothetical protein
VSFLERVAAMAGVEAEEDGAVAEAGVDEVAAEVVAEVVADEKAIPVAVKRQKRNLPLSRGRRGRAQWSQMVGQTPRAREFLLYTPPKRQRQIRKRLGTEAHSLLDSAS